MRPLLLAVRLPLVLGILVVWTSCVSAGHPPVATTTDPVEARIGLMLMAHGGDDAWNRAVLDAVHPIQKDMPVEVAFGMAAAEAMQQAAETLERRGAKRIVVVRLFISGDSFVDRTEQILGLKPGAPPRPPNAVGMNHDHANHDMASMPLWRIDARAEFVLTREGLMDADSMGEVLAERAAAISHKPAQESVLVIGHGPESDVENERWLARMDKLAEAIRKRAPFRDVRVETLREDWPERRKDAEARIRSYVASARADGGKAIVIPFRVAGFGPYANVLQGLEYLADKKGLLPSRQITDWIREQAKKAARRAGWVGNGEASP
jgi:sirohydrochlorin cobaltochelatase